MADIFVLFKPSNTLVKMVIRLLGNDQTPAYQAVAEIIANKGHKLWQREGQPYDLAVAPLLTEKVSAEQLKEPLIGTLIFHPSPLPYGRGAASIKWAYKRQEQITAATWFWADNGWDTGDICEQEIVKIDYNLRPRDFYNQDMLPALQRTFERCLNNLQMGYKRRVPQVEKYSSFDRIA